MSSGLQDAVNYHAWIYSWIKDHIHGSVLDIGGGTANHIRYLESNELMSIDISKDCISELRERYAHLSNWSFEVGDITDTGLVDRIGAARFDTVLSSNVFEHIERDDLAMKHAAELLRPGGRLVLVLPAHESLYGDLDRMAGHFRRYNRKGVQALFDEQNLEMVELKYVNYVGALGWYVNNRLMRHDDLSSPTINGQIALFDKLVIPVMRLVEKLLPPLPFGQSLVAVAVRRNA